MHSWTEMEMMRNFEILDNFSEDIIQAVKHHWDQDKHSLDDESRFVFVRPDEYQDYIIIKRGHSLYDTINAFECASIVYLRSMPRAGMGPIHIDSNRGCALNIPIRLDTKNSFCFVANEECTERLPFPNEPISVGSKRYEYEPEKYSYFNVRKPCLLNTKMPHGFANYSDHERVLLSVSFSQPYDEVLKMLYR